MKSSIFSFLRIKNKLLIIVTIYAVVLAILVGARGYWIANRFGGQYLFSSFLFDFIAFGLIIILLHLFNYGVKSVLKRIFKPESTLHKVFDFVIYAVIIILIAGSFIFTILQIHPQRIACKNNPKDFGLENYNEVTFESGGLKLSGWFIPTPQKDKPIILITHGLGANKENFLYPASIMNELGYNVFLFDFRAHGDSEGYLTTFGMKESRDVKAAYDWLATNYPSQPVYALAYSLGGAAVIKAADEYDIFDRIVLDSTFADMRSVVRERFGTVISTLWHLVRFWAWVWTSVDMHDNQPAKHIARLKDRSILIIHGTKDTIIPHSESLRLHEATGEKAELWLIDNMQHIQGINHSEYKERLYGFFEGINEMLQKAKDADDQERIRIYRKIVDQYPDYKSAPSVLYYLAGSQAFVFSERDKRVEETFKELIKKYPESQECLAAIMWLISLYKYKQPHRTEDLDAVVTKGIEVTNNYITKYPTGCFTNEWKLTLAELYSLAGLHDDVMPIILELLEYHEPKVANEQNALAMYRIASLFIEAGKTDRAKEITMVLKEKQPLHLGLIKALEEKILEREKENKDE